MLCCLYFFPFLLLSPCTEKYNFLGISIVGQSNERGDGGIYIGSIMKGGAVAADGRIEPGDMLLQVCVRDGAIGGVRAVVVGGETLLWWCCVSGTRTKRMRGWSLVQAPAGEGR